MKKTSTRLASLGGFVLLGACAIAMAQRDSRKRESEPLEFASTGQAGAELIQVDSDWSPPYGKQKRSPVVRANNDDRTSYTLSDDPNPLRGGASEETNGLALPKLGDSQGSPIRTASHQTPIGKSNESTKEPTATVRLASGEVPSDPPAWSRESTGNRYPNPGSTSNALPPGQSGLRQGAASSGAVNPSLPGLPQLPTSNAPAVANSGMMPPSTALPNRLPGGVAAGAPATLPALPPIAQGVGGTLQAPNSPYPNSSVNAAPVGSPASSGRLTDSAPGRPSSGVLSENPGAAASLNDGPTRAMPAYGSTGAGPGVTQNSQSPLAGRMPPRSQPGPDTPNRNTIAPPARNGGGGLYDAPQSRVSDLSDTQRGAMAPTDLTQRPNSSRSLPPYGSPRSNGNPSGSFQTGNVASANWPPTGRAQSPTSNNASTAANTPQGTPSIPSLNSRASFSGTSTANRGPGTPQTSNSGSSQGYTPPTR
ncbi:MAG: hypothetical protein AAGG44_01880, partial [Planctomycetota bacterium]